MDTTHGFTKLLAILGVMVLGAAAAGAVWLYGNGNDEDTDRGDQRIDQAAEEEVDEAEEDAMITVDIHFADEERTQTDFTDVVAVERETDRQDVAAFSLEQMIEGPNEDEQADGLFSELELAADSESACGGEDFSIETEDGVFVVWMCRMPENYGTTGGDAIAMTQITETMSQFPEVEDTVVLDMDRNCFGDRSGQNRCYDDLPEGIEP